MWTPGRQYTGSATLSFSGAAHLAAQTVTGLKQDDQGNVTIITPFVMPVSGAFTSAAPPSPATGYTTVTIGLGYNCNLQTLPLRLGSQRSKPRRRLLNVVGAGCRHTWLHHWLIASTLVPMKDLVIGNVSSMSYGPAVTDRYGSCQWRRQDHSRPNLYRARAILYATVKSISRHGSWGVPKV